jgi:diacylglycerol kinase (ATP)
LRHTEYKLATYSQNARRTSINGSEPATAFIVNPSSSGGSTGKNWENINSQLRAVLGLDGRVGIAFCRKGGDGTSLARQFLKKGYSRIVAIGGDGTINEVANGFFERIDAGKKDAINKIGQARLVALQKQLPLKAINPDAVLIPVPCGTRNVLARSLGLPLTFEEYCANFAKLKPARLDLIAASTTSLAGNPKTFVRVFLNAAEIGLGAEIISRSKKVRNRLKSRLVSTTAAVVATLPAYQSNLCKIYTDRRRQGIVAYMTMTVISNGPYLGGGFRVAPDASVSDGMLDIVVLKNSGSFKILEDLVSLKLKDPSTDNDILYMQTKSAYIESEQRQVSVTVDGEPVGTLPAIFRIIPSAISVMM